MEPTNPSQNLNQSVAPDFVDPVVEAYKKDVDRTLLRENLRLTVQERFDKFKSFMEYVYELRRAGGNRK